MFFALVCLRPKPTIRGQNSYIPCNKIIKGKIIIRSRNAIGAHTKPTQYKIGSTPYVRVLLTLSTLNTLHVYGILHVHHRCYLIFGPFYL